MKNVRVWYRKDGACRFISHLDIYRTFSRALIMSGVPLWHTEGYNSRLYVSFALPLSLGFRGVYESVDIRFLEDDYSCEAFIKKINECLPRGLTVYNVAEPIMKPNEICYARYVIYIKAEEHSPEEIYRFTYDFMQQEKILAEKKNKKGELKQVNLKENISLCELGYHDDCMEMEIILPAGNEKNVNPQLLIDILEKQIGYELFADVTRRELYTQDFRLFK